MKNPEISEMLSRKMAQTLESLECNKRASQQEQLLKNCWAYTVYFVQRKSSECDSRLPKHHGKMVTIFLLGYRTLQSPSRLNLHFFYCMKYHQRSSSKIIIKDHQIPLLISSRYIYCRMVLKCQVEKTAERECLGPCHRTLLCCQRCLAG